MATFSLRKKSGRYYARAYDKHRSPKRKERALGTTRKDVARRLTQIEEDHHKGIRGFWADNDAPQHLTVQQAVERYLDARKGQVRQSSIDAYRCVLNQWRRDYTPAGLLLRDVQAEHLRPFIHNGELANATKRKRFRHLGVFLSWAEEHDLLQTSPLTDDLRPRKEEKTPAFLTPDQVERLLRAIDAHAEMRRSESGPQPDDQWLKDMVQVACCTGPRRGELLALRWQDVDLDAGRLFVRNHANFKTKSGDERVVPLAAPARRVLLRRRERPEDVSRVFTDRRGLPIKPDRVSKRFKHFVRKAKLRGREDLHFHSTRHSCGAWLASQGVSTRIIQQVLGHASPKTTQVYSHLMPSAVEDAVEQAFSGL